jgi:histidine triad (HIT) family protein
MKESEDNCIFCKILKGESPVSMIYEDEKVAVFVDLQPVNEGHLLIIPRLHAPYMQDVDTETLKHIIEIAKRMNKALRDSKYKCEGVNLFVADGEAAHQEVFHFHLHIYPRFKGDGFGFKYDKAKHFVKASRQKMDEIAKELKEKMSN